MEGRRLSKIRSRLKPLWEMSHEYMAPTNDVNASWMLESYASQNWDLARQTWFGHKKEIQQCVPIKGRNWESSWDKWPQSIACRFIATGSSQSVADCEEYLERMLGDWNLGGPEMFSRQFCGPWAAMAMVYQVSKRREGYENLASLAKRYLRCMAAAHTLVSVSLKSPVTKSKICVMAPGFKTRHSHYAGEVLGLMTEYAIGLRNKGIDPGPLYLWPARVMSAVKHDYLTAEERSMLRGLVKSGGNAPFLLNILRVNGVTFRGEFTYERYSGGGACSYAETLPYKRFPAIMAMSCVDDEVHATNNHGCDESLRGSRVGRFVGTMRREKDILSIWDGVDLLGTGNPETVASAIPAQPPYKHPIFVVKFGPEGAELL